MACLNRSRTLDAPMPTNISTNSEPDMEKNGTLRFAGDSLGEHGLAGARRAYKQQALGHGGADLAVLSRGYAG